MRKLTLIPLLLAAAGCPPPATKDPISKVDASKTAEKLYRPAAPTTWTTEPHPDGDAPKVDIVFCLDSTGSMQKLIDTAKEKIREIAKWVGSGEPKPTVRFAVVEYRDKKEAYVTKLYALTPDVAKIEGALARIKAAGGGDGPEHVVAGLKAAVEDVAWDPQALKFVFLLGDAPPHLDYGEESNVEPILTRAKDQDIAIGAFVVGDQMGKAGENFWEKVSQSTGGSFERIASNTLTLESVIYSAIGERAKARGITYSY